MTPEQREILEFLATPMPSVPEWPDADADAIAACLAERDALLGVCQELLSYLDGPAPEAPPYGAMIRARVAIRDAKGGSQC